MRKKFFLYARFIYILYRFLGLSLCSHDSYIDVHKITDVATDETKG